MREGREKNIERFVNRRCLELVTQEDTATGQGKRVIEGLRFIESFMLYQVSLHLVSQQKNKLLYRKQFKTTHL